MPSTDELNKEELLKISERLGFSRVNTVKEEDRPAPVIYTHADSPRFFNESQILFHLMSDKLFVHLVNELFAEFKWLTDATVECYAVIIETTVTSTCGYRDAILRAILETQDTEELKTLAFIEPETA